MLLRFYGRQKNTKGNGYNIPEIVACPDVSHWLYDEDTCRKLHKDLPQDKSLPEQAKSLFCDAYICMYKSQDLIHHNNIRFG